MTSAQIRQSFLDFFQGKQHSIVPSSSLLPDSPNLLFTNAGMNQFVPIFLGQRQPDASTLAGATPGLNTRAADTQKCIRAGGKHNDLEDVGFDTYHHTFFEMLGNWSFGDYFKQEAIDWAWELITEVWKFPPQRLYATVYKPGPEDPASFDQEAWDHWARHFTKAGLDPHQHIVNGNKKDNFWMMGDTGPCGPCSEIHVDLTPQGDTQGRLVNTGDARCIEIWNLVFIQFNANPDGTFTPLPAQHVDTGMGFERVTSIIQGTRHFTDFTHARISNYETDIFRPIFDALETLSGKRYHSTLPTPGTSGATEQEKTDIAFRVIADHLRTLSFAIADGIQPGNEGRHYVLRRILRRAIRYGRNLGLTEPFFYKLPAVLAEHMGAVFPEIRTRLSLVEKTLRMEEESFNRTLDRGMELFEQYASNGALSGAHAFKLYDTFGFPPDLTELLARERHLSVDLAGFHALMEEQRTRARQSQKKTLITLSQIETTTPTRFVGFDTTTCTTTVLETLQLEGKTAVILDTSVCYAEMGGQVGDAATLSGNGQLWRIADTRKSGDTFLHLLDSHDAPNPGDTLTLTLDTDRRAAIERHHTATHLLHWALHEVLSAEVSQKGSCVTPDHLTFDFNSAALTPAHLAQIEQRVNARILENLPVSWCERPYAEVRHRKDIQQFFGDKYGQNVRVVQIGGTPQGLDGFSMELCGGTHTQATGSLGFFKITSETAIAAGIRRIEALAGEAAYAYVHTALGQLQQLARQYSCTPADLPARLQQLQEQRTSLEKELRAYQQKASADQRNALVSQAFEARQLRWITATLTAADAHELRATATALTQEGHAQVVLLAAPIGGKTSLVASCTPEAIAAGTKAGDLVRTLTAALGGKGGGKADLAMGGAPLHDNLDALLRAQAH